MSQAVLNYLSQRRPFQPRHLAYRPHVRLVMPAYGNPSAANQKGFWRPEHATHMHEGNKWQGHCEIYPMSVQRSLLANGFNLLWAQALTEAKEGKVTTFAMQHGDIHPEAGWLDMLVDEMHECGAVMMSALAPIKDERGLTSTAVTVDNNTWIHRNLLMKEAAKLPETFTAADMGQPNEKLLVNTGLWVADLRWPGWRAKWPNGCLKIRFNIRDEIVELPDAAGTLVVLVESEDWQFSRLVQEEGGRIFCTRKVRLGHEGCQLYPNYEAWGAENVEVDDRIVYAAKQIA